MLVVVLCEICAFEILSDHTMFLKHRYFLLRGLKYIGLDGEEIEVFKPC